MTPPTPDAGAVGGERVRLCLRCGEMIAFDVRVCPACGHFEPATPDLRAASRACGTCGRRVAADAVFCPECGDETGLVPPSPVSLAPGLRETGGRAPDAGATDDATGDGITVDAASTGIEGALVAVLAWAGPAALLAAVVLIAAARGAAGG